MKSSVNVFFIGEKDKKIIKNYFDISDKAKMSIGILENDGIFLTDENLYYVGSISKIFTSLLVLKTIEKYGIDIHTGVNDFLHLQRGNYPTIYECLTHTAKNYLSVTLQLAVKNAIRFGVMKKNPYENVKADDILKRLEKARFSDNQNRKYRYSDLNYAILAIVLEKIEGRNITELLQDFIANDLQLKNTYVGNCGNVSGPVLKGKYINDWVWNKDNPYIAAGGIVSNVSDMMRLAKTVLDSDLPYIKNASVLCPESESTKRKIMTTYSFHTYQKSNQLWHVGKMGPFRSMLIINKVNRCAVITLSNCAGVKKGNAPYVCKMLYGNMKRKKSGIRREAVEINGKRVQKDRSI